MAITGEGPPGSHQYVGHEHGDHEHGGYEHGDHADGGRARGGLLRALRRWTIPVIGALTPGMLIVANVAAFIIHHLYEFRWGVAVLAFVSGIMLDSWAGLNVYRVLQRRTPGHGLVREENQPMVLVAGLAVILIASAVTAWFCFRGLSDERSLPNATTFVTGILAILLPVLLQSLFGRALRHRGAMPTPGAS